VNKPSKKQQLKDLVRGQLKVTQIYQNRPYTCAVVEWGGQTWTGFTKANWPDPWRPEFAKTLAVNKVVGQIVRALLANGHGEDLLKYSGIEGMQSSLFELAKY
jgi:hypothetical protein